MDEKDGQRNDSAVESYSVLTPHLSPGVRKAHVGERWLVQGRLLEPSAVSPPKGKVLILPDQAQAPTPP